MLHPNCIAHRRVSELLEKGPVVQFDFDGAHVVVNMTSWSVLKSELCKRFRSQTGFALATINLDHIVKLSASKDFVRTYAAQDLVTADGRPIVALSRLANRTVELLPGSDMVVPMCELAAQENVAVGLVGSTDQALSDASKMLRERVAGLKIALTVSPSRQFDPGSDEAAAILGHLEASGVGLCFLALGAPKQEQLAVRGRALAPSVGFASVGAGLDFLGGHQRRAPVWMRRVGLEWVWRMLSSPWRMVPRYARCFVILPRQVLNALRLRRS